MNAAPPPSPAAVYPWLDDDEQRWPRDPSCAVRYLVSGRASLVFDQSRRAWLYEPHQEWR